MFVLIQVQNGKILYVSIEAEIVMGQTQENLSTAEIWELLDEVKDPEIPVVSLVEMGMIRQVGIEDGKVTVIITPTFAGCPALHVMEADIIQRLKQKGVEKVKIKTSLNPPWTTDLLTPEARRKLKEFGLSPPPIHEGKLDIALEQPATCPYCNSENTTLQNDFGPTLCRAIYTCDDCQQPFEQFKPI